MHPISAADEATALWIVALIFGPIVWMVTALVFGCHYEVLFRYSHVYEPRERRRAAWRIIAVSLWPLMTPVVGAKFLMHAAAVLTTGHGTFGEWRRYRLRRAKKHARHTDNS